MLSRIHCPITGATDCRDLVRVPYDQGFLGTWSRKRGWIEELAGQDFAIRYSPGIDFYFQQNVLEDSEEASRRERLAGKLAKEPVKKAYSLAELSHKAEDALLIRLLHPGKDHPKVFDFGMATGEWLLLAKGYGAEVWGTDLDPRAIEASQAHGIRFTTLEDAPDGFFDFINADQVFEHLPEPLRIGQILAQKLAPGGILKLTTPGDPEIQPKLERLGRGGYDDLKVFEREFFPLAPLSHVNLYTARSLRELGTQLGLTPYQIPLGMSYGAMTGFFSARQLNRNLIHPWKRHLAQGTWQFFVKG